MFCFGWCISLDFLWFGGGGGHFISCGGVLKAAPPSGGGVVSPWWWWWFFAAGPPLEVEGVKLVYSKSYSLVQDTLVGVSWGGLSGGVGVLGGSAPSQTKFLNSMS